MLEIEVVEEIQEIMKAMHLPFIAIGLGASKQYFGRYSIADVPFEAKHVLLEDLKFTYEKLALTPWYSERDFG